MPTKTKPKQWKQGSVAIKAVPPADYVHRGMLEYIVPKNERRAIVNKHCPNLSGPQKEKVAEGIEAAVRKFPYAVNIDNRPLPANVGAQMVILEKLARGLLQELQGCDDLTAEVIERKADKTPPLPPSPKTTKGPLLDAISTPLPVGPMDPPDRLISQLQQYADLFSDVTKNANAMGSRRKRVAFPALVNELHAAWRAETGRSGKGDPLFTDFVEAVAQIELVRKICPPTAHQRLKIQRALR
jgi:hypothetical protein